MPKEAALYWHDGDHHVAAIDEQYFELSIHEIMARKKQIENETAKLDNLIWLSGQLDFLIAGCMKYPDKLASNASKRENFKTLLKKYFTSEEKELKVLTLLEEKERELLVLREKREREFLKTLRLDIFILLCLTFTPTQFKAIFDKGLEGLFAEVTNKYFKAHWDAFIPCGTAKRVISIIESESTIKTKSQEAEQLQQEEAKQLRQEEAEQLRQGLVPYLSPDNQHATTYTAKTSFPTTPSVGTRHTEEHTQTRESHLLLPPSTARHILPPLTPNTTNTEAGALPPGSLHFSQQASTVGYNHGHSQRPIHEQVPQGSNRASESTASIPPSLLDSWGNYLQQHASKRQRVGNWPQDTSESESNMSARNGTSVGNQIGTKYPEIRERRS
ncbi:hypothetical protein V490_00067 [Pseudogymnoascus sp. VKM F-3557]|nr:hypothetical protein V490_00067 [Pseudogymnoascus sp. VKM F-3557]